MYKTLLIAFFCLATGCLLSPNAYAQAEVSADQVFESYFQATGGSPALASIQDRTLNGTVSVFGMSGTILWHEKVPNKTHQLFDMGMAKVEMWFDGNQGYRIDPNRGDGPYSAEEIEEAKDNPVISPLLGAKERGLKFRYVKIDKVGDKEADVVEATDPKGRVITYYFDKATHYLVQIVTPIPESRGGGSMEVGFSDYRDVKGVKFPFKIVNTTTAMTFEMVFDSIEVNTGLADTVFQHASN
jgi:hypothetical protein